MRGAHIKFLINLGRCSFPASLQEYEPFCTKLFCSNTHNSTHMTEEKCLRTSSSLVENRHSTAGSRSTNSRTSLRDWVTFGLPYPEVAVPFPALSAGFATSRWEPLPVLARSRKK